MFLDAEDMSEVPKPATVYTRAELYVLPDVYAYSRRGAIDAGQVVYISHCEASHRRYFHWREIQFSFGALRWRTGMHHSSKFVLQSNQ